jgi:tetratricopeptide (TPR) repeat protein
LKGRDNQWTVNCLINAAENLYFSRRLSKSLEIYETLLEIKDNDFGNLIEISRYFLNIIHISTLIGKKEKSQKYYEDLIKRLKKNDYFEFSIFNELGNLFMNSSNHNEAMNMYNSAL